MKNISQWTMTFALVTSLVTPSFKAFAAAEKNAVPTERVDVQVENTEQLTPEQQAELEKITYNQLADPKSEFYRVVNETLGKDSKGLEERNKNLLKDIQEAFKANSKIDAEDKTKSEDKNSIRTQLQTELAKVKVEIPIPVNVSLLKFLDADIEIKRTVQATNNSGEQLRIDTLEVELKTSTKIYAGARIRITFAKVLKQSDFPGENLKLKATTEDFFWFMDLKNRIPTNASEVKKLKIGQTFRLEIDGVLGAGFGKEEKTDKKKINVGVGYSKGATFLVDIARVNETYTRTRFLGLKNKGAFGFNVSGKKAIAGKLLPGIVGEVLSLGIDIGLEFGDRIFHKYPVDSMMVVYGFNSKNPEANAALDQIFANMKQFGFMKIFNPTAGENTLAQNLLDQAPLAEKLAKEDAGKADFNNVRVKHEFRGRMTSHYYRRKLGGNLSIAVSGKDVGGGSNTFVRKIDEQDNMQYFILDNQNNQQEGQLGQKWKSFRDRYDLDLLVASDEIETPGDFLDLVVRNEHEETNLRVSEIEKIKKRLLMTLPKDLAKDSRIDSYFPTRDLESASYVIETSLSAKGYKELAKKDRNQMVQNLIEWLEKHPSRQLMHLPSDGKSGELDGVPLWKVAEDYVHPMHRMLNGEKDGYLLKEFKNLKGQAIFGKWIVGEFLPSQLSGSTRDLMRYTLKISSDSGTLQPLVIGDAKPSDIYNAVNFMRRVLNDRGFEMRLDEIEQGK